MEGHFKLYANWKELKNNVNIEHYNETRMHSTSTNTNREGNQQVVTPKAIMNYQYKNIKLYICTWPRINALRMILFCHFYIVSSEAK